MYKEQQRIKNATVIVELKEDLELNFYSDTKLSDLIVNINGKLNEDINRISEEFRNVTNIDVILKQVSVLIKKEIDNLKGNTDELSKAVKEEIIKFLGKEMSSTATLN